jgi:hypothetical protein
LSRDEFESVAKRIVGGVPELRNAMRDSQAFGSATAAPEVGLFSAALVGFAIGAATRIIDKSVARAESNAFAAEALPQVVSAFIVGAVAGARVVDGKP